jgi:hypothetical protein
MNPQVALCQFHKSGDSDKGLKIHKRVFYNENLFRYMSVM